MLEHNNQKNSIFITLTSFFFFLMQRSKIVLLTVLPHSTLWILLKWSSQPSCTFIYLFLLQLLIFIIIKSLGFLLKFVLSSFYPSTLNCTQSAFTSHSSGDLTFSPVNTRSEVLALVNGGNEALWQSDITNLRSCSKHRLDRDLGNES